MNAKQVTFNILDAKKPGERFSGIKLMQEVKAVTGQIHYPATMLRYVREYRSRPGHIIKNVNKSKSIYEVIR